MCRKIVSGFSVMLFVSRATVLGQRVDDSYNPPKFKLVSYIGRQMNVENAHGFHALPLKTS